MNSYLMATSYEHCLQYVNGGIDLSQLVDCNVVAVLHTNKPLLAKVNPPDETVTVMMNGSLFTLDVRDLFNTIQQNCICWCEV